MTEPGDIDEACDAAEKFAGEHESEGRIVADVSDAVRPQIFALPS